MQKCNLRLGRLKSKVQKVKNNENNKRTMTCNQRPGTEKAKTNDSKGRANEQCNLENGA